VEEFYTLTETATIKIPSHGIDEKLK